MANSFWCFQGKCFRRHLWKIWITPSPLFERNSLFRLLFFFFFWEKVLGGKERTLTDETKSSKFGVAQLAPREIFDPSLAPSLGEKESEANNFPANNF